MMLPAILHYDSREALALDLAEIVAGELDAALAERGHATLAVPGGTTPGPFLSALSLAALDWPSVRVLLTDERFVPESSERSNTRLLRGTLLQNRGAGAHLVPLFAEAAGPEAAIGALSEAVTESLPLDVCVLGMGADMHTASLFPGGEGLDAALSTDAPPLVAVQSPDAGEPRITLSSPVLRAARTLHILIQGVEKQLAFARALEETDTRTAPVRTVLTGPTPVTVHYAD